MPPVKKKVRFEDSDSAEKGDTEAFLDSPANPSTDNGVHYEPNRDQWLPSLRTILAITPWILTAIFAALSGTFWLQLQRFSHDTYETSYRTDFDPVGTVPLERIRFTGTPHFHHNGSSYALPVNTSLAWPENKQYFGPPTDEIDQNWEKLIGGRYFEITEEEARRTLGEGYREYWSEKKGRYEAGLDVFHTLHCINAIRKALHPDLYPLSSKHGEVHIEHCLNILRQSVQCAGSTTLIPTRYMEGIKRLYIDSDQVHTCRSFEYLREWLWRRKGRKLVGGEAGGLAEVKGM